MRSTIPDDTEIRAKTSHHPLQAPRGVGKLRLANPSRTRRPTGPESTSASPRAPTTATTSLDGSDGCTRRPSPDVRSRKAVLRHLGSIIALAALPTGRSRPHRPPQSDVQLSRPHDRHRRLQRQKPWGLHVPITWIDYDYHDLAPRSRSSPTLSPAQRNGESRTYKCRGPGPGTVLRLGQPDQMPAWHSGTGTRQGGVGPAPAGTGSALSFNCRCGRHANPYGRFESSSRGEGQLIIH